jgi:arabinofuranosyltransferase
MIVAFLPPMWDFATSGLETGLTFAWVGLCILALVWRLEARPGRHAWAPAWVPVLIGLGPLIRPDLALMVVCFGIALLLQSSRSILGPVVAMVIAGLLPLAWQIFRMGYFASLVPNTALAKSAGGSRWDQGLTYLWDVVGRYGIHIALSIILLMVFADTVRSIRSGHLARTAVLLAPVAAGLLHATYIARVGGDFMHGRLLLPGLFAFALAQAVIPLRHHAKWALTGAVVIAVSSIVAGLFVRFPYFYKWDPNTGIADERVFYTSRTRDGLTLSRHDWRGSHWHKIGTTLHNDAAAGQARYQDGRTILPAAEGRGVVYTTQNLGVIGVVAGNEVFIADRLALADVVTARIPVDQSDTRVGHAKRPAEWRQARYAAPLEDDPASVRDARIALRCGKLAELGEAITQPMSPQRFFENLRKAPSFTMLTVPKDLRQARAKFCGSM